VNSDWQKTVRKQQQITEDAKRKWQAARQAMFKARKQHRAEVEILTELVCAEQTAPLFDDVPAV
jgi:hypothetical protein